MSVGLRGARRLTGAATRKLSGVFGAGDDLRMNPACGSGLRSMVISAAMGALALVLPVAFHLTGMGSRFLPMLLPLLLNGYLSSPAWAAATGALIPWLSALSTGMPPLYPPVALIVSLEGFTLAAVAGLLRRYPLWMSVPGAVVSGRAMSAAAAWVLAERLALPPTLTAAAVIVQGLPGVALQLTVVPLVLRALRRRQGLLFP